MIGDRCFITAVRPNRDASEKLAPGDEVLAWQGYTPKRENLWSMSYVFNTLLSLPVMNLSVRGPDGATRKVDENRQQLVNSGDALLIWKMPEFFMTDDEVDHLLKDARKYPALIMDLRGNPGGLVKNSPARGLWRHRSRCDHCSARRPQVRYQFKQGADTQIFYGASITDADLIMGDGKSLEHTGVVPNEVILPSPADLAAGREKGLDHFVITS